jgi:predicted nucleotidyltransferase
MINYKGKIFTGRGLAGTANVSTSEAAVVVEQLQKYGIIRIQPVGKSYQISLNEKSYVLNKIIKPILRAEEQTLNELCSLLKKYLGKRIVSAAIFGSISRGEEKDDSDIDLLVISNDFDFATGLVSKAQEEVSLLFHSNLSPLILSEKEFRAKKNDRFVRSILDSYIMVAGKDLRIVVRE